MTAVPAAVAIGRLGGGDRARWELLARGYKAFYETELADAERAVAAHGGRVLQATHPIGPHGHRAIVVDSEGNRVALHSMKR